MVNSPKQCKEEPISDVELHTEVSMKDELGDVVSDTMKSEPDDSAINTQGRQQSKQIKDRTMMKREKRTFECEQCDMSFSRKPHLLVHLRSHSDVPYRCNLCNKSYSKEYLPKHMLVHTGDRPFSCDICKKTFQTKAVISMHMRIHTGERPFVCKVCGATFSQSSHMHRHVQQCQTTTEFKVIKSDSRRKRFTCGVCNKGFTERINLTYHSNTHTGIKPYNCETCGKSFAHPSNLQQHRRKHTRKSSFSCEICNKSFFYTKKDFVRHSQVHAVTKPVICNVCQKPFAALETYSAHARVHTISALFQCDHCKMSFEKKSTLRAHILKHMKANNL